MLDEFFSLSDGGGGSEVGVSGAESSGSFFPGAWLTQRTGGDSGITLSKLHWKLFPTTKKSFSLPSKNRTLESIVSESLPNFQTLGFREAWDAVDQTNRVAQTVQVYSWSFMKWQLFISTWILCSVVLAVKIWDFSKGLRNNSMQQVLHFPGWSTKVNLLLVSLAKARHVCDMPGVNFSEHSICPVL